MKSVTECMRLQLLTSFIGLRYRLLWAQARIRNGKAALFIAGYLLLCLLILLFGFSGIGAAMTPIQTGKADVWIGFLLSFCFLSSTLIAVVLGTGMDSVFSDSALRRYPISAAERFAVRHLSACLEPLWLLVFALYLGLAIGFGSINGAWIALPTTVLLLLGNYLFARVFLMIVQRVLSTRFGPLLIVLAIILFSIMPTLPGVIFHRYIGRSMMDLSFLRFAPPFAAAICIAKTALFSAAGWLFCLLGWCIVLAVAIHQLDRLPISSRTASRAQIRWNTFYDRIAACFGVEMAPLAGKILRYYLRSNQMRYSYPILVCSIFITLVDPQKSFFKAIGFMSIVGSMCMGAIFLDVFGFDGAGFRRYFLLPVPLVVIFRTMAMVPLMLGTTAIPLSLVTWLVFAPIHTDAKMITMLISYSFGGMFFYQALGLWTSLLSPRAIPFKAVLGERLSFFSQAVMWGSIVVYLVVPPFLNYFGIKSVLEHWWIALLILLMTLIFYLVTLCAGAFVFSKRREILLATIERGC
jgi:hypothetical protein